MLYPLALQTFALGSTTISLYVPHLTVVQKAYEQSKAANAATPFPYWAQVWPAALALGEFLVQHPDVIQGKTVLELAAGLGLPSLAAARWAQQVTCTDYIEAAVQTAQQSAHYNGLHNMQCTVLNWHQLPADLEADVLLLSDVNYEPAEFDAVYNVVQKFVATGTTVIISTPQRLMAKPFVSRLLTLCTKQHVTEVMHNGKPVPITIMILQKEKQSKA